MGKSVAFKCTYNDGGEGTFVGFSDTCSRDNIDLNVKNSRVWCNSPDCKCRQYQDQGMNGPKPRNPCYESVLFSEWRYGAGRYHTGVRAGTPVHIRQTGIGKFAILTTRFPNEPESQRRIIGLFQIGRIEERPETVLFAAPRGRIRLPLEEARELYYWAYCNTGTGIPDWRTGLFRYLEDSQVHCILADIASTVRDEKTKAEIKYLIEETVGNAAPPPANGCLAQKSVDRPKSITRIRKYGSGGEGEEHRKLKMWLSRHPQELGLTDVKDVEIEHRYLSGDAADLIFSRGTDRYTVVEVETNDPLPGAHQAIKYRALLCAEKMLPLDTERVETILVAWSVPEEVQAFCEVYGIEFQTHKL